MPRLGMLQGGYIGTLGWEAPSPPLQCEEGKLRHTLLPAAPQGQLESKELPMAPPVLKSHQERSQELQDEVEAGLKSSKGKYSLKQLRDMSCCATKARLQCPQRSKRSP